MFIYLSEDCLLGPSILEGQGPIRIAFDAIEVHPAAIIVKGHDDGTYQRIREEFLAKIKLLPGTNHLQRSSIRLFVDF